MSGRLLNKTKSLDKHCIKADTDRKFDVVLRQVFLALKLYLVKGHSCEIYISREVSRELQEESKDAAAIEQVGESSSVSLVILLNKIYPSIFPFLCMHELEKNFTFQVDSLCRMFAFPTFLGSDL